MAQPKHDLQQSDAQDYTTQTQITTMASIFYPPISPPAPGAPRGLRPSPEEHGNISHRTATTSVQSAVLARSSASLHGRRRLPARQIWPPRPGRQTSFSRPQRRLARTTVQLMAASICSGFRCPPPRLFASQIRPSRTNHRTSISCPSSHYARYFAKRKQEKDAERRALAPENGRNGQAQFLSPAVSPSGRRRRLRPAHDGGLPCRCAATSDRSSQGHHAGHP